VILVADFDVMKNSVLIDGIDLRERFGIVVESIEDLFLPKLRERKLIIPGRSGAIDYGAKYYDERELILTCGTVSLPSRADVRELSYICSKKSKIVRWDEPDKYYIGRIYDPNDIQRFAGGMKKFQLVFLCEPFAYGSQVTEQFVNSTAIDYAGTAQTPTVITIKNNNSYPIAGITITMTEEVES